MNISIHRFAVVFITLIMITGCVAYSNPYSGYGYGAYGYPTAHYPMVGGYGSYGGHGNYGGARSFGSFGEHRGGGFGHHHH